MFSACEKLADCFPAWSSLEVLPEWSSFSTSSPAAVIRVSFHFSCALGGHGQLFGRAAQHQWPTSLMLGFLHSSLGLWWNITLNELFKFYCGDFENMIPCSGNAASHSLQFLFSSIFMFFFFPHSLSFYFNKSHYLCLSPLGEWCLSLRPCSQTI